MYEVTVDGRRAVYKGNAGPTGSAGTEGRVIAFVGDETSVPVPVILAVGNDYFVAAWHPDAPTPGEEATEEWATAAGRGLGRLHDETDPLVDGYGEFRPGNGGLVIDGYDDWHAAAIDDARRRRSALVARGHADVADAVVGFLRGRPAVFDGADGPVCCHGWATPEHVGVRDGRVACVVDFEHAIAAPGEFDYWRAVLPAFGPEAGTRTRAFREGYESVRPLPAGFERRRPAYLVLDELSYLESLCVQDRHGPDATGDRARWLRANVLERVDDLA